jgi:transcriptional regulator with XRE-family HTH domain
MTVGEVLRKERTRKGLAAEAVAVSMQLTPDEYQLMEVGTSAMEKWGVLLSHLAVALETPVSRLLSLSGKAVDVRHGNAPKLIRERRERCGKSAAEVAQNLEISEELYREIELGETPIEEYGRRALAFAELVGEPVFNLFFPCGLPVGSVADYS